MNIEAVKRNFSPSVLLPSISCGLINAIILISVQISFAALIFSGDLAPFLPRGIGILLLGMSVSCVLVALLSSLPEMIGVPQDTPAALMALVAAGITVALKGQKPEVIYSTAVGAIIFVSLVTAALFFALGWFKASAFVRYVPYPVIGGFLAGTGYLLSKGAFGVMVDLPLTFATLPQFFSPEVVWRWLPGTLFGLALLFIQRRYTHYLITPGAVVAAIFIFYLYLFLAGISVEQASTDGWLLGPFPAGGLFKPFTIENLSLVQWSAIFTHFDTFATLFGLSVISLLLNASGLEVIYKQDIDLNRELIAAGSATLIGGLIGCIPIYQTLGISAMANRLGARSRLAGIFTGLFCGFALFFGASVLSFFPRPVLGGMLFLLGISFLAEWLVDSFKTLPRMDYFLIWTMVIIIYMFGFLQAIGAGVIIAALLFVVSYGSMSAIKNTLSGDTYHSKVERPKRHKKALTEKGAQIHILVLQGYIFFGSIQRVLQNIRGRMSAKDGQPLSYIVLDFQRVKRLDSSTVFGFTRLKQLTEANNIAMTWTNLSDKVHRQLGHDLLENQNDTFMIQPTLDHGIEWCEDQLLAKELEESKQDRVDSVLSYMSQSFPGLEQMKQFMEQETFQAGDFLIRQGETSNDMFFIESGLVTVEFQAVNGEKTRLRSVQAGATVGEVNLYLGGSRSASVKAEQPSVVYRLTAKTLRRIQKEDPARAALLHEWLAHLLAERLADNNRIFETLLE